LGLDFKIEPCSECFLTYFVPPEHRDKENPCHYIPLNRRGDTVASLTETGDNEQLQKALRTWLQKTIFRLAEAPEAPGSRMAEHPLLSMGDSQAGRLQRR
jgi:hypothetical protein